MAEAALGEPDRSPDTASAKRRRSLRFTTADGWAGLAATAVILPQAMAFGVALLAPHGIDAATGALAGLIGTAALCLLSGAFGGTPGLISAPTGPTFVLLSGALTTAAGAGLGGPDLLTALAAIMVVTGIFQSLIGISGGGRLIKFIPYTVVSGFLTGSAVLMFLSQIHPLAGGGGGDAWTHWRWIPAATAAVTFAVMHYAPRFAPRIPGTIAGLIAGTLAFQLLVRLGPGPAPEAWVIGTLPGPQSIHPGISLKALEMLPWPALLLSGLALAVLASLDTLFTAVIADVTTGARHDARRELMGQGAGQIVSGLLGGMAGAGTTGATVVSVKTGGRRWPGVTAGLTFAVLILFGGPVGTLLPISALAGIILRVAVGMLDRDIIAWAKRRRTRTDAGIALLVIVVTVAYNLMAAVGVGVAIALVFFVRAQVKAPVIHRRSTATQTHSLRERSLDQRELLDRHGDRIVIVELRGRLFFGTADRLYEQLGPDLDRPVWLILNMRRIRQVDLTGAKILQQIAERLHAHGGHLIFCEVHKEAGLGHKVRKTLRKISPREGAPEVKTFNGGDEALEYAEDGLLKELGAPGVDRDWRITPAEMDFCENMSAEEISAFENSLRPLTVKGGKHLFKTGDHGDELYLVVRGEVDIRVPTTRHHYKRLAHYGPGTMFGEITFLEPGPRSADAVALRPCELLILDRSGFENLKRAHPAAAVAVLMALGRAEGRHLRWTTSELRRLSEW